MHPNLTEDQVKEVAAAVRPDWPDGGPARANSPARPTRWDDEGLVDITDASAVVFFAPVIRRLEDAGHTVTLTARRFAGADLALKRYGLGGLLTTQHRGGSLGTRAVGLVNRTAQLLGLGRERRFDVACGSHASDFVLTAWTLAVPQMTFLDPDRLGRSNLVNVRLVDEVAVPEAVPVSALVDMGAARDKLFRYAGFKEEYYLHDAQPDLDALARLGVERRRVTGVARAPASRMRVPAGESSESDEDRLLRSWPDSPAAARSLSSSSPATRPSDRGSCPGPPRGARPRRTRRRRRVMAAADFVVGLGGAMSARPPPWARRPTPSRPRPARSRPPCSATAA